MLRVEDIHISSYRIFKNYPAFLIQISGATLEISCIVGQVDNCAVLVCHIDRVGVAVVILNVFHCNAVSHICTHKIREMLQ